VKKKVISYLKATIQVSRAGLPMGRKKAENITGAHFLATSVMD
jgi:hypothetical protein